METLAQALTIMALADRLGVPYFVWSRTGGLQRADAEGPVYQTQEAARALARNKSLLASGITAIAYETVEDSRGRLPLLAPMSAVAGNMAVTVGDYYLARPAGGKGVLLGRVLGSVCGKVVVIGDGIVGQHAARVAAGIGAQLVIFGRHPEREAILKRDISPSLRYLRSEPDSVARELRDADLVVGAVLIRASWMEQWTRGWVTHARTILESAAERDHRALEQDDEDVLQLQD